MKIDEIRFLAEQVRDENEQISLPFPMQDGTVGFFTYTFEHNEDWTEMDIHLTKRIRFDMDSTLFSLEEVKAETKKVTFENLYPTKVLREMYREYFTLLDAYYDKEATLQDINDYQEKLFSKSYFALYQEMGAQVEQASEIEESENKTNFTLGTM